MEGLRSLEIGVRAIRAQREALHTIGHNIANVNTPGFSRQRAILTTTLPSGSMGTGVKVQVVERIRHGVTDFYIRKETPTLNQWKAKFEVLEQVEVLFNEPSEAGISNTLGEFWDAWADLGNNPESGAVRANLKEQARTLCESLSGLYGILKDLQTNIDQQIESEVEFLNSLTQQIGDLNQQIERIELGGRETANDLRDSRDYLLDGLSETINFTYREMDDSIIRISIFGQLLVSKSKIAEIMTESGESGYLDVRWKDTGENVVIADGKLKGLIDARDQIIPEFLDCLDNLTSSLIEEVNYLHRRGMGLNGDREIAGWKDFTGTLDADGSFNINGVTISVSSGNSLSDIRDAINAMTDDAGTPTGVVASLSTDGKRLILRPGGTSSQTIDITADPDEIMLEKLGILADFFEGSGANDISLSDAIINDINKIAASQSGAPGDNSNALAINLLKGELTVDEGTSTFGDYYSGIIGKLGVETRQASYLQSNKELLLTTLKDRRQSICGVSLDEEMTNIILFQQAYRVAVAFLKTVNDMLDILTTSMGV